MAMLKMMDVTETIAETIDDYIATAIRFARYTVWRGAVKAKIAANKQCPPPRSRRDLRRSISFSTASRGTIRVKSLLLPRPVTHCQARFSRLHGLSGGAKA
jgi:hypothetical protein